MSMRWWAACLYKPPPKPVGRCAHVPSFEKQSILYAALFLFFTSSFCKLESSSLHKTHLLIVFSWESKMGSQQKSNLLLLALMMMIISLAFVQELQAIPISRTLSLADQKKEIVQEETWNLEADNIFFHGRSDIESQDYPGSGANHSHEPRPPGRP